MSELINNFPQYLEHGKPCAFYVVWFGQPNQDTKNNLKPIYSDALNNNELPNPQILNKDGQFEQEIHLNGLYSILIERPNGTIYKSDASIQGLGDTSGGGVTQAEVDATVSSGISLASMFHHDPAQNSGLDFHYGPYILHQNDGNAVINSSQNTITVVDNTDTYVYLNPANGNIAAAETLPNFARPLWRVTALGGTITGAADLRSQYRLFGLATESQAGILPIATDQQAIDGDAQKAIDAEKLQRALDGTLGRLVSPNAIQEYQPGTKVIVWMAPAASNGDPTQVSNSSRLSKGGRVRVRFFAQHTGNTSSQVRVQLYIGGSLVHDWLSINPVLSFTADFERDVNEGESVSIHIASTASASAYARLQVAVASPAGSTYIGNLGPASSGPT